MKRTVLVISCLILSALQINSQSNKNIGISAGAIKFGGLAFGGSIFYEQEISNNLEFIISSGIYLWNYSRDINHNRYNDYRDEHVIELPSKMIPSRLGLKFNFGNSPSHPFATLEWGLNYIEEKLQEPKIFDWQSPLFNIKYDERERTILYASFGMSMGYSFCLSENLKCDLSMLTHLGSKQQYINFIAALKHSI